VPVVTKNDNQLYKLFHPNHLRKKKLGGYNIFFKKNPHKLSFFCDGFRVFFT